MLNTGPRAEFTYSPDSPTTQDNINFTDLSDDTDGYIFSWYWDFGDGTTSDEKNPTHRYVIKKTYYVILTVTDDDGDTNSTSKEITISNIPPVASITYSPENPTNLDVMKFTDNSSDLDGHIVSWYWDFGDGTNSTEQNATHQYNPGRYTIILTVTDDNNASNNFTQKIIVSKKIIPSLPEEEVNLLPYIITVLVVVIVVVAGIVLFWIWKTKKKKIEKVMSEEPTMRLRCKKCGEIFPVEIKEKPVTFKCPKCGTEGVIK